MTDALREQLAHLPTYLGRHLLLTVAALGVGIGVGLPVAALVATRARGLKGPVLALAGMVQTIPSIALLAIMVPLLGIGFLPAWVALTAYGMLPVIRNTVTGIEEVDPNLIEAGRGLGMTDGQLLRRVQLPLALPVIIAGVRTATVWVVGIATLSTPVGATSLGDYIFGGLANRDWTSVYFGCVAAILLALALDQLIRGMEISASRRRGRLAAALGAVVLVVVGAGLVPVLLPTLRGAGRPRIVVGAKTFTEQFVLASMIADRLESEDIPARVLRSLGSTIVFDALAGGQVDCYVDYSGTIWANHMGRERSADADVVLDEVTAWLEAEHDIACLGRLGFENTYALAMRRDHAERLGIGSVGQLVPHASTLRIGGDYEFFGRPEWRRLQDAYGLAFADTVGMDGTLMYSAVASEEIDVIAAFSTDGRIAANDLLVLDDPRGVFPPYDAILLLGPGAAGNDDLRAALRPLLGAIDAERMREANRRVNVDGEPAEAVGRDLARAIIEAAGATGDATHDEP